MTTPIPNDELVGLLAQYKGILDRQHTIITRDLGSIKALEKRLREVDPYYKGEHPVEYVLSHYDAHYDTHHDARNQIIQKQNFTPWKAIAGVAVTLSLLYAVMVFGYSYQQQYQSSKAVELQSGGQTP